MTEHQECKKMGTFHIMTIAQDAVQGKPFEHGMNYTMVASMVQSDQPFDKVVITHVPPPITLALAGATSPSINRAMHPARGVEFWMYPLHWNMTLTRLH
jgi:hypothetical protein